jgi:hypothetical protein
MFALLARSKLLAGKHAKEALLRPFCKDEYKMELLILKTAINSSAFDFIYMSGA